MPEPAERGIARTHLPVTEVLDELLSALGGPGAAVLVAPPGTGKTTGVPPALVAQPWAQGGRIVVVEPRRLAVRTAAARMAEMAGESVGRSVGYSVRGERRVGPGTRIEVVTEGLFLRRIQLDPTLEGVSAVLLDEFHERSLDVDLALALTLDVRSALRPDLRLLVMSATIDPEPVAAVLGHGGDPAAVVAATAPLFPVETRYRPGSAHDRLEDRVTTVVREALRDDTGDVLVFLPGRAEIRRTRTILDPLEATAVPGGVVELAELHGSLSPDEQLHVVRSPEPGRRRVILSTSLAETSITVPGVRVVVDAGRRRTQRVDPDTGLPALRTGPVSRAGADQRRGRAGRLGPGVAYRLWSENDDRHRPADETPEMLDGDLTALVLQLHAWGVDDPGELGWLDVPPPIAVRSAKKLLTELGALAPDGRLTALGRAMAGIGFHPRLAAIAVEARRSGLVELAADALAVIETSRSDSIDLAERVRTLGGTDARLRGQERDPGGLSHARRLWRRTLEGSEVPEVEQARPGPDEARDTTTDSRLARLLLAGFADRVARRRDSERSDAAQRGRGPGGGRVRQQVVFQLCGGGEVALDPDDPLTRARWLVVVDLDAGAPGTPGRVHLAVPVPDRVVSALLVPRMSTEAVVGWDQQLGDVVAQRRRQLGTIVVSSEPLSDPDPAAVSAAFTEGITRRGMSLLPRWSEADDLRGRVAWMAATHPDDDWPDWSEDTLVAGLSGWLGVQLGKARRAADLQRIDVVGALSATLDHQQRRSLDLEAPTHWSTGVGRKVKLRYGEIDGDATSVVASVSIRDVIGIDEHPRIGRAHMPVTLELLSPAGRPVQRTNDLPGFWRGSYSAVRADLRGRYPKHPWPDRPWEPFERA